MSRTNRESSKLRWLYSKNNGINSSHQTLVSTTTLIAFRFLLAHRLLTRVDLPLVWDQKTPGTNTLLWSWPVLSSNSFHQVGFKQQLSLELKRRSNTFQERRWLRIKPLSRVTHPSSLMKLVRRLCSYLTTTTTKVNRSRWGLSPSVMELVTMKINAILTSLSEDWNSSNRIHSLGLSVYHKPKVLKTSRNLAQRFTMPLNKQLSILNNL